MTQQDNWRPEMARLTRRQDQLERQQRETTTRVDSLNRDVDRRMDSQRRDMNRQSKDRDWRVSSLERSRDTLENLFWFSMPLVAAAAVIIILVIAAIASREQCRECAKPEQRSPSSIDAPLAGSGGPLQPGFVAAGTPFRQHRRYPGNQSFRSREPDAFNPPPVLNDHRLSINPLGSTVSTQQFATCSATWPAGPDLAKPLLTTGRRSQGRRLSTMIPNWLAPGAGSSPSRWTIAAPAVGSPLVHIMRASCGQPLCRPRSHQTGSDTVRSGILDNLHPRLMPMAASISRLRPPGDLWSNPLPESGTLGSTYRSLNPSSSRLPATAPKLSPRSS